MPVRQSAPSYSAQRENSRCPDVSESTRRTNKVPLLAFGADVPGVEQFQIVQTEPTTLRVRLRVAAEADGEHIWEAVRAEIARVLAANGLDHVTVNAPMNRRSRPRAANTAKSSPSRLPIRTIKCAGPQSRDSGAQQPQAAADHDEFADLVTNHRGRE